MSFLLSCLISIYSAEAQKKPLVDSVAINSKAMTIDTIRYVFYDAPVEFPSSFIITIFNRKVYYTDVSNGGETSFVKLLTVAEYNHLRKLSAWSVYHDKPRKVSQDEVCIGSSSKCFIISIKNKREQIHHLECDPPANPTYEKLIEKLLTYKPEKKE